ncbi:50S ribosomal protein L11 methyltransferase [bacterium]|nr:50S ribosomal protein L11 methyltransferase [bacterium]
MKYLQYTFRGKADMLAMLAGFLFEDGFEGLEEKGTELQAYIADKPENYLLSAEVKEFMALQDISYQTQLVDDQNWNALWEAGFEPINVMDQCLIRAGHHPTQPGIAYDILIEPKMSFGTGHHPTTYLMVKQMLGMDFSGKSVFDFGTGTGVLAILAEKMGAAKVFGVDIDENCIANTHENFKLNSCAICSFQLGDIDLVADQKFDVILANVTRNILLQRWPQLVQALSPNGLLLISGFYNSDLSYFEKEAHNSGMHIVKAEEKDQWMVVVLKK